MKLYEKKIKYMERILLIEDDGELAETISEKLYNYSIEEVYSYATAIDAWEEHKGDFKCIILDLEIPPDGLEDETLKNEYHGIHGILVLEAFCEGKTKEEKEAIWAKTVVYSAYTEELQGKKIMKNPPGVPKSIPKQAANSISKLVNTVKEIIKQKR